MVLGEVDSKYLFTGFKTPFFVKSRTKPSLRPATATVREFGKNTFCPRSQSIKVSLYTFQSWRFYVETSSMLMVASIAYFIIGRCSIDLFNHIETSTPPKTRHSGPKSERAVNFFLKRSSSMFNSKHLIFVEPLGYSFFSILLFNQRPDHWYMRYKNTYTY